MSLRDQEYCQLANEQMERERMVESWRVAGLTDEERANEQFERDEQKLNQHGTCGRHGFSEERVKEIAEYATAKWRRLNPEKAAASDAHWAAIRAQGKADEEKERLRLEAVAVATAEAWAIKAAHNAEIELWRQRRRPQVGEAPAKKRTIVNGVLF